MSEASRHRRLFIENRMQELRARYPDWPPADEIYDEA